MKHRINLKKKKYPDEIIGDYPDGHWERTVYDNKGNKIYWENHVQLWVKFEWDENNRETYREGCDGYWMKWAYDENGKTIYHETINGVLIDRR